MWKFLRHIDIHAFRAPRNLREFISMRKIMFIHCLLLPKFAMCESQNLPCVKATTQVCQNGGNA